MSEVSEMTSWRHSINFLFIAFPKVYKYINYNYQSCNGHPKLFDDLS